MKLNETGWNKINKMAFVYLDFLCGLFGRTLETASSGCVSFFHVYALSQMLDS